MTWALLCRETFEHELAAELIAPLEGSSLIDSLSALRTEPGLILSSDTPTHGLPNTPFVFERQRLRNITWIQPAGLKPTARDIVVRILPAISRANAPWTLHCFAPDVQEKSLASRATALHAAIDEMIRRRFPAVYRRMRPNHQPHPTDAPNPSRQPPQTTDNLTLQVCVCQAGIFGCVMPTTKLSDSCPGGLHRMRFDNDAPSRSYLKIEETFDRMEQHPQPGQTVVDLGAAPGGWTYSFLKHGCHVTAVDNAQLRIPPRVQAAGRLQHLQRDGISFIPPPELRPVDWLASDMLQVAGTNIGMLRKWVENRWMRRFVFNVKIPQQNALETIRPVHDYLRATHSLSFTIRQLYHDRREVTIWGSFNNR